MKTNFENCEITSTIDIVSILDKMDWGDGHLLTLENLYIKDLAPDFNTKAGCISRTLTL